MFRTIKELFRFDFLSPLGIDVCREHFTPEYKQELLEKGQYYESSGFGWSTYIYHNKKNVTLVDCNFTRLCFTYRFTLTENDNGTILNCKHNLFAPLALFFPTILALVPLAGAIASIIELITSPEFSGSTNFWFFLAFFIPILALCFLLEGFARKTVNFLVWHLVDAKPVN